MQTVKVSPKLCTLSSKVVGVRQRDNCHLHDLELRTMNPTFETITLGGGCFWCT